MKYIGIEVSEKTFERLSILNNYFRCDSKYNHWEEDSFKPIDGSSVIIYSRQSVLEMLIEASKLLPKGYHFKIYDAYRPIIVQQRLYDYYKNKKQVENPNIDEDKLNGIMLMYVSKPSYDIFNPSLHNTGGAVDLTIVDSNDNELDMGCKFDCFEDIARTNYFEGTNSEIEHNRKLLCDTMNKVGFVNLQSEWWHYDYGDRNWAIDKGTKPFYVGILDTCIKGQAYYKEKESILKMQREQMKYFKGEQYDTSNNSN